MSRIDTLHPAWVGDVPERLERGVLYVSTEYATMLHLCACGCGEEVVLPLSPVDWKLTFDGETVSVWPSVGSWGLPCRSHYVVERGRIRWADQWSDERIAAGRAADRKRQARRYASAGTEPVAPDPAVAPLPKPSPTAANGPPARAGGIVGWLRRIFGGSME